MTSLDLGLATFSPPEIEIEHARDRSMVLRSRRELGPYATSITSALRATAAAHPDRVLAAARSGETGWTELTFGEARERADALAQAFLDLGLGPDRPILVLSGNSLEHLVVTLAAYTAGVPLAPVSVAYSLMSHDHARLRAMAELTQPGLVFADDAGAFGSALDVCAGFGAAVLVDRGQRAGALRLSELARTQPGPQLQTAYAGVRPDTLAKLLFTSGSTGVPKAVITTHRMLCSNQAMSLAVWPFLSDEPPIMVDWLPWSHTFGGSHNVNLAICHGGTLYIDDGRPTPALFGRTLEALRDVAPTVYFNVPAGYGQLVPALEDDRALAEHFFSRLRFMFYAAAALPTDLAARLRRLASEVADHPVPLTSSWGATETAPAATSAHFPDSIDGCIGVPIPGTVIKLAPNGDKLEIRVAGPNVTPGYFRQPDATAAAFDEDGFYRTGDAVKLIDPSDPNAGLLFDGRIAEDFKLVTGTWVTVGTLRTRLVAEAGVLSDAVICGHDTEFVAALAWLNQTEAARVVGTEDEIDVDDPRVREHLAHALTRLNRGAGSASRVERLLLLTSPPSIDAGEITDKGYINQRACLRARAAEVARLCASDLDPAAIVPASPERNHS